MSRDVKVRRPAAEVPGMALAAAIEAKVGHPVTLIVEPLAEGALVRVFHGSRDAEVEISNADVEALTLAAKEPDPEPDPLDVLADELKTATTLAGLKTALAGYAVAEKKRRPKTLLNLPVIGAKK